MAGEHQPSTTVPDPTQLVTEAIERAIVGQRDLRHAELDVLRARLDAMDEATKVLHETVTRIPTDVQQAVGHLKELTAVELESVALQFKERDTRSERESRDNKTAVDAAFSAQKEAAAKQDEANQKAIDKSEKATAETVAKNADSAAAANVALSDKIDDLKERVARIESAQLGATNQRIETRQGASASSALIFGVIAAVVAVASIVATIVIAVNQGSP